MRSNHGKSGTRKARKLALVTLGALAVLCLGLWGCGSRPAPDPGPSIEAPQGDHAIDGSLVYVDESDVVFWGQDEYLCTALIDDDNEIYDFVIEAAMSSKILSLAVYEDYLYIAQEDGFFKYPLSMFSSDGGDASSEMLLDQKLQQGFAIHDGYIYYRYGNTLNRIQVEGGEPAVLNEHVSDFEIVGDVIYFTTSDDAPGLYQIPVGGSAVRLAELEANDTTLAVTEDQIFCKSRTSSPIYIYSFDEEQLDALDVSIDAGTGSAIWAYDDVLVYADDGSRACCADLGSGNILDADGEAYFVLDKVYGTIVGGRLFTFNNYGSNLYVYDFDTNTCGGFDTAEELADQLAEARRSRGGGNPHPSQGYGVFDDWSGASGDGWEGEYPEAWRGFVGADVQENGRAVRFYEAQSSANGYGGTLVTLVRTSDPAPPYAHYDTLHEYSDGTTLYALYPTDVQFNPDDPGQYQACNQVVSAFIDSLYFYD